MMAIMIELRIPLFIVGKPGSSKSLAKSTPTDPPKLTGARGSSDCTPAGGVSFPNQVTDQPDDNGANVKSPDSIVTHAHKKVVNLV